MAATIALMVGSAIVNALAFTGGNYLFSKLDKQKSDEERIRHDKALENLQTAQAEYAKNRQERLDFLNDRIRKESHSEQTFHDVDEAIKEYFLVTGDSNIHDMEPEPKLGEFYEESDEQKQYELMFMAGGLVLTGITAFRII